MINLMSGYGKKYKVTRNEAWPHYDAEDRKKKELEFWEIVGKRGYIRPWGETELELYVENIHVANRIERELTQFKPKNHYDDGAAFVFEPIYLAKAVRLIHARKRREVTPEQRKLLVERLARMRSKPEKGPVNSLPGS